MAGRSLEVFSAEIRPTKQTLSVQHKEDLNLFFHLSKDNT